MLGLSELQSHFVAGSPVLQFYAVSGLPEFLFNVVAGLPVPQLHVVFGPLGLPFDIEVPSSWHAVFPFDIEGLVGINVVQSLPSQFPR